MRKVVQTSKPRKNPADFHSRVEALVDGQPVTVLIAHTDHDRIPLNVEEFRKARRDGCAYVRLMNSRGRLLAPMSELVEMLFDQDVEVVNTKKPFYAIQPSHLEGKVQWLYEVEQEAATSGPEKVVPFGVPEQPTAELALALGASKDHYNPTAKRLIKALRASGYKRLTIDISTDKFELE